MTTTISMRRLERCNSPQPPTFHRTSFARDAVLAEFGSRAGRRGLDQGDFADHAPGTAPVRLGVIAAEVVGDAGEAALAHWLREAARTEGEEHEAALEIAREIAGMIGVEWTDILAGEAA